jgi:hypothetical protein
MRPLYSIIDVELMPDRYGVLKEWSGAIISDFSTGFEARDTGDAR